MFPKYEHRDQSMYAMLHTHQCNYPARFHKHVEIMIVVDTTVKVTIHGTPYTLKPGDLYIAFPNVLHAIEANNATCLVMLVDFEKQQAFHELLLHHYPQTPVLRKGNYPDAIRQAMERMILLAEQDSPFRQQALTGYANAILGELLSYLSLVPRNMDGTLLQQLQFYILENYTRDITLESVAKELGYSKFYISRSITDLFGCNFRTLLGAYRIDLAQSLLATGSDSIAQIAQTCGFRSQSAFNRTFLQQTGMPPRQYRQQAQHGSDAPVSLSDK